MKDDDSQHMCFCAQQLISTLFGVLFGFIGLLLSSNNLFIALIQVK
jgi:hypothetical protein